MDRWTDRRTDKWTDRWMDRRTDRVIDIYTPYFVCCVIINILKKHSIDSRGTTSAGKVMSDNDHVVWISQLCLHGNSHGKIPRSIHK